MMNKKAKNLWQHPTETQLYFGKLMYAEVFASKALIGNRYSMPAGMKQYNTVYKVRGASLGREFATRIDAEAALAERGYAKVDHGRI